MGSLEAERILSVLVRHEVEFIVVGGIAATLQGAPLATFDLDILRRRRRCHRQHRHRDPRAPHHCLLRRHIRGLRR